MNIDKKCKNQIDGEIPFTSKQIHAKILPIIKS